MFYVNKLNKYLNWKLNKWVNSPFHINHKKPLKLSFRPLLGSHMLISAAHKFSVDMSESKLLSKRCTY